MHRDSRALLLRCICSAFGGFCFPMLCYWDALLFSIIVFAVLLEQNTYVHDSGMREDVLGRLLLLSLF